MMNASSATHHAIEIVKILCANPSSVFSVDTNGANQIADFIETLENRLTDSSSKSE